MNEGCDVFESTGAPPRIALRRSRALRAAVCGFSIVAAIAVYLVIVPRGGGAAATTLAAAAFAALMLAARAHERRQPASLSMGPDGIAAYDAAGGLLAHGRIAGYAQWADRLLVIALDSHDGTRAAPLVVAADALGPEAFRELAVRTRHAGQ